MMQILVDGNGTKYFNYNNVRVGIKHVAKGDPKNWASVDRYLQIFAHRDPIGASTFPGPQIPISDSEKRDDVTLLGAWWHTFKATT